MKKEIFSVVRSIVAFILTKLILAAMIIDASGLAVSVVKAVETCLYTIIPALFGFMVISSFLLKSGLYRIVFKPFYLLFSYVIKLNEEEFGIFLLSLFGGYPVGAKLLVESHKKNTEHILPFCYCPGPGFVIAVVGIGIFSNAKVGLAVYISNVLTCVLLAIILSAKNKKGFPYKPQKSETNQSLKCSRDVFISSVMSASSALFPVCAIVVTFGVLNHVLRFYGIERIFALLGEGFDIFFFAVMEISNASKLPPSLSFLPIIAALFSFGGLCIITQIPAITKQKIPLKRFFLWRIPAALMSALICKLIVINGLLTIDYTVPVITRATGVILPSQAQNPIASAALLIMSMILVKTAQEKRA